MAKRHRLVGPVLLVAFLCGVLLHGKTLEAVKVTLLEGAEEPADGGVAGIGGSPPDYRLEVKAGNNWLQSAVFKDTRIGDGLHFEVPGPPPYGAATTLRLVEDDKIDNDILEELPIEGESFDGKAYRFELQSGWSLGAGFEWFLSTPLGAILALGASVALVVLAASFALRNAFD
ncbi:MAG: hypothetical protein O2816_19320 [Planctomycetota bacterium]|nr:hypothetical protein [Planctomycetota bacterium]